jgi:molybdopterin-guanine dinucleotide biosynthesis protein MobB
MVKALCIVGQKGVGKTTLIERLIPALRRRGYRVATVKRPVHHFEFDLPGKDSRRHFEAGAEACLVYGDDKVALVRRVARPPQLEELLAGCLADADLVLVEGHKGATLPKIEVFRSGTHPKPLYQGQAGYLAIASDAQLELGIPWLRLDDVEGIVEFIVARFPPRLHIPVLSL